MSAKRKKRVRKLLDLSSQAGGNEAEQRYIREAIELILEEVK